MIRDNDKDGDKKLSWAEVEPIGWSKEKFELKDMNGNGDGKVQKDEWWWGDEFAGYDKDKDGTLDEGELPLTISG